MKDRIAVLTFFWLIAALLVVPSAGAFEILTEEDITENIITREMLIATADNFVILYDASGSMADEYKAGVAKLEAELDALIERIGAAQQEDGYLDTYFTLTPSEQRWSNCRVSQSGC